METERIALSQRERDRLKVLHEIQQKHLTQVAGDDVGRPIRHRFPYFAPFARQVSRESRGEFGAGFAPCAFEDGLVIHIVGGTLAAGLR